MKYEIWIEKMISAYKTGDVVEIDKLLMER